VNYKKSECLKVPHGNSTAWRYMDHEKFMMLLIDSAIFFANANKLSDQYEVTIPDSVIESRLKELQAEGLTGPDLEEKVDSFYYLNNPRKELVLVNCWSVSRHESYALWKIYIEGEQDGIAIKTRVSNLRKVMKTSSDPYPQEYFIGKVAYRKKLKTKDVNNLTIFTTKKPFYDFEKELRLFILNDDLSQRREILPYDLSKGRNVIVNLEVLIEETYISPFSDETYKHRVQQLLSDYNLGSFPVKDSEIRDQ